MKKRTFIVAALLAEMTIGANAQENLALGKTAVASSEQQAASNAVDGNFESRWEVKTGDEKQNGGVVEEGSYWIYVDLGEKTDFNTLRIKWEGGYAKKFKVLVADDLDEATGKPAWKETAVLEKEETLSDFTKYYTYFLDNPVNARYVKLQAEELGLAPYFSIYEMGIYNLDAEQKTPTITTITASKGKVAPGEEFTVNITDQFGNAMTDGITYTCTNAENLGGGKFKALAEGQITITAKDGNDTEKTITLEAYSPAMTIVKVSPAIVIKGEETSLTFTVKDQEGVDITDYNTGLTDNKFTATENGANEITVTSGGVEKKVTVYAVSESVNGPTLDESTEAIFVDGTEGYTISNKDWNGKYDNNETLELSDDKVLRVSNVGTFGIRKETISGTGYKSLNFDIFPSTDIANAYVNYESAGANYARLTFSLEAGKWNHVSLNVDGAEQYSGWIQIYLGSADAVNNPDILLDNVYLSKDKAEIVEKVTVAAEPNARGFYAVSGYAKSAETINAQLTDENITAYDLTNLNIEGEEAYTLQPANHNALIYVKGTGSDNFTPEQNWGETKNIIGFNNNSADQWYVPTESGISLEDGYAVYQGSYISAKAGRPVSYTRSLPAGKHVSTFLPVAADVPAGCKAYAFVESSDENTIGLEAVTNLNANTPYIIYNDNSEAVDLTFSTTADIWFTADKETAETFGNATVKGNFSKFSGDGTQYVLDGNSYDENTNTLKLKKCTESTAIVPFRVYFTLNNPATQASEIKFVLPGNATGINDINANTQTTADVYSIDGRLVKHGATSVKGLASGVYVMNGKKYVVK